MCLWTQRVDEVEVLMNIDGNLRARHLAVVLKRKSLMVMVKGVESTPIIDEHLNAAIEVEESTLGTARQAQRKGWILPSCADLW